MSLVKKIAIVASGTMMSRILGFIREMLMAMALGTGPVADAFNAAFRFPNTFRRLFAEGAFNSAFVPLFSKEIEKNIETARQFSEEVFGVLFSILLMITIIMEFSMPFLITHVIAPGFSSNAGKFEATVRLTTIMFPYLACMSLSAMMGGMLNSLQRYFAPAIAPVFLNIILIGVLLWVWFSKVDAWNTGLALSWGVMAAGIIHLLIVWLALRNAGMKIGLRMPHFSANVRRLVVLALPAAITGGITQINLLINTNIASADTGAVSSLVYADRLYQLPLSILAIAVATVLLPELSRALRSGKLKKAYVLQNRSMEFILLLSLPAAAAFLIMSKPIVRLLFEHGQFDARATTIVSGILAIYGLGLPAFVLIKAFIPIFFSREDTKTPMICAGISVVVNVLLSITLFPSLSGKGIAIAEITAGWINAILLFIILVKRRYWSSDPIFLKRIPIFLMSSVTMALILSFAISHLTWSLSSLSSLTIRFFTIATLVFCATLIYFAMIFLCEGVTLSMAKRNFFGKRK
ncbi:MAG: putative peptidoglycan lipid II flippase [Candidatus Tokpelaia sp. JSC188]|nr:MAG: putative peptidoglycan lipid II flippase [Candidatus Tokpelaia sp. JSC188]